MQSVIVLFVFLATYGYAIDIVPGIEECKGDDCLIYDGDNNTTLIEQSSTSCQLCEVTRKNIVPTMLKQGDKVCYVDTANQAQYITYVSCAGTQEQSKCTQDLNEKLKLGYETSCVQKYTTIKLLCFDEARKHVDRREIHYPSSCDCVIHSI